MKIIFLDIDGVLNSHDWWKRRGKLPEGHSYEEFQKHEFDPEAIKRLHRIVKETGAEIVLSSAWRLGEENRKAVKDNGVDFVAYTPTCTSRIRGAEIEMYLRDSVDYKIRKEPSFKYAIIDDDSDMLLWQKDNFFQTKTETGLTDEIADAIIKHLNS